MTSKAVAVLSALWLGGIFSAGPLIAQTDCTVTFDETGYVDAATLAQMFAACADQTANADNLWVEFVDRGTYALVYSGPEGSANRRATGLTHLGWAQEFNLEIGLIFGFRTNIFSNQALSDDVVDIIAYLPDGPDGSRDPEITRTTVTPGSVEAALFIIGSEALMIPGAWRIELRNEGRILAAQSFVLKQPPSP